MLTFVANTTNRLDKFLADQIADVSRSRIQRAIKAGLVTVDGIIIIDSNFDVTIGNQIVLPQFSEDKLSVYHHELKVIYENTDLAVIDKPAGLVVHPGAGNTDQTLANALLARFPGVENVGEPHRPGIVHRLDEDTSGLIIIAKTLAGYEYLKSAFAHHEIEKEYLALAHGLSLKRHDFIELPIGKSPARQKMKIDPAGKAAKTEYFVLAQTNSESLDALTCEVDKYTLFRVKLHTGRTHQIRVHLAAIDHPLVGDKVYGGAYKNLDLNITNRQFLHAYKLKFQLMDKTWIELVSEIPPDLKEVLSKLKIHYDNDQLV